MNRLLVFIIALLIITQSFASPYGAVPLEDIDFSNFHLQNIRESTRVPERSVFWNKSLKISSLPASSEIVLIEVYSDTQQAWEEFLAVQQEGKFIPLTWENKLGTEVFLEVDSSLDQAYRNIYNTEVDNNTIVEMPVSVDTLEAVIRTSNLPVTPEEKMKLLAKIAELESKGKLPVVRLEYNADGTVQYTVEGTKNPKQVAAEFYSRMHSTAYSIDLKSCESIWTTLADIACANKGLPLVWMSYVKGVDLPESATDTERICYKTLFDSIDVIRNSGTEKLTSDQNGFSFYLYTHGKKDLQKNIEMCSENKFIPIFKFPSFMPISDELIVYQFTITSFVRRLFR